MNQIKNKLRSRAGVSMILAMVFMLFCSFVGSTVLASATANAQRVAQLAEQQDFMLQRSAALLVSDQFRLAEGQRLRMTVVDQQREIQGFELVGGGVRQPVEGKFKKDRVITFNVVSTVQPTALQRLMLEATVWRYLYENTRDLEADVTLVIELVGFPVEDTGDFLIQQPTGEDYEDDGIISGTMQVTSVITSAKNPASPPPAIPEYLARFSIGRGEYLYDFFVDFGEDSQVKMTMNGYSGTGTEKTLTTIVKDNSFFGTACPDVEINSRSTTTTISWQSPLVEKGGAQ